jgi:hypothetical protein
VRRRRNILGVRARRELRRVFPIQYYRRRLAILCPASATSRDAGRRARRRGGHAKLCRVRMR